MTCKYNIYPGVLKVKMCVQAIISRIFEVIPFGASQYSDSIPIFMILFYRLTEFRLSSQEKR